MRPTIMVVAGPTASGKSALALRIAEKSPSVIINADSQQIYRDLRILTARPSEEDEAQVPHKLYGTLGGSESCSAGMWLRLAKMEIDWARSLGVTPIVVGGTGLYLKALMQGIADIPAIPAEVRAQAVSDYEVMGKDAFAARLREIDPPFFERLKVYDRQRLIRAYEVWLGSGKTLSYWHHRPVTLTYPADNFTVHKVLPARQELYQRCDMRVNAMVQAGAVEEVRTLLSQNFNTTLQIMKSLGVAEFAAHIRGDIPLEQAISNTQHSTRNYAKRQMTWLRHQLPD